MKHISGFTTTVSICLLLLSISLQSFAQRGNESRRAERGNNQSSREGHIQRGAQPVNSFHNNRHPLTTGTNYHPQPNVNGSRPPLGTQPPHNRYPNAAAGRYHPTPVNRYRYIGYRPVYSARNPSWRYGYLPRRNSVVTSFNFSYQTINYGGYGYRYYNGCYYRPHNNAFIVVAPPLGIFINVLPFGYRRIVVRNNDYYYYNGTYYDHYQNNYRVVTPPLGAVVESIPQGYETIIIDGETYYKTDNVQYKPVVQDNGEIWYEVIKVD